MLDEPCTWCRWPFSQPRYVENILESLCRECRRLAADVTAIRLP